MAEIIALSFIAMFILVLIGIGYYYRHHRSPEDFFMAGRKAGMIRIVASIFTLIGAGEIVTLTAFAFIYGLPGISLFVGSFVAFILMTFLIKRINNKSSQYKPYSITDYIREFIGTKSEKISLVLSLVAVGALLVIQFVVGGLLISSLTGLSYTVSVIIIGLVIAFYLTLGGFNSVLTTDLIQAIGMIFLLLFLLVMYNPTGSSIPEIISAFSHSIPPIDFIVLFIAGFFAIFGAADVYQRVYATRSEKEVKKGLIVAGTAILIFSFLMILLGLKIFTQFPDADPNSAFFNLLDSGLSTTMVTLLSVFIVASLFSTADTELFVSSILIGKLIKGKKELKSSLGQLLMWLITIAGILIALFFTALVDIYFVLLFTFMIIGPVMLARLFGRGNDNIAFSGMLLSSIILIVLIFTGKLAGAYPLLLLIPTLASFLVPAKRIK